MTDQLDDTDEATRPAPVRHAVDSAGRAVEDGVAVHLGRLARELRAEPDPEVVLQRVTAAAVAELDGAAFAGISLVRGRTVEARAATDPVVVEIDEAQHRLDEGPCLDSLRYQSTVRADDLACDERWPQFAAEAVRLGARSMLSVQLFVENDNLGSLNVYGAKPHAFGNDDEGIAIPLAVHAAVAIKGAAVESNLHAALISRDVIGQAKGIMMERYKISATEAFELLVVASQKTQMKLRAVADEVAATGELRTS